MLLLFAAISRFLGHSVVFKYFPFVYKSEAKKATGLQLLITFCSIAAVFQTKCSINAHDTKFCARIN